MAHPESDNAARDYWDRVEEVFAAALTAGDSARTAVLDARCGAQVELRAEVEALLAAHARAGDFITPYTFVGAGPAAAVESGLQPGTRIGAFKVIERIAHGGMGDVYRAERVEGEFTQQVAIKLIAAKLHGAEAHRRFRAERQILASLQHPNIVTLVDGGVTADGQPFFVMEYVDGLPITELCRRHRTPLEPRLRLFHQICVAVGFAHRHLVVHRDLKPGNVLVTGDGIVKVLDFGVAKLLGPDAGPVGATESLLGPMTPNYASPEQVRGLPVTTASDVYALGVMLYELLAGQRPYETGGRTVDEVIAMVVDREPSRPSATQGADLPYDVRRLGGDLDAIILKAIAKPPGSRYGSAEELGEDVVRVLSGAAVVAREPSFTYVARKAIARHRGAFGVAAVFCVLLIAALVGAIWQANIAARERERAVQRFNDVRQLAGALIFRIHDEVAPLAGSTPVRQTVIAEGLKFLERLEAGVEEDPGLRLELAQAYLRIGNVQGRIGGANLGNRESAIQSYRKARHLVAPLAGAGRTSWEAVQTLVDANLALAYGTDRDEAVASSRTALATATEWAAREPQTVRAKELLARANQQVAVTARFAPDSLPNLLEANRLFDDVLAEDEGNPARMRNAALIKKYLGRHFDEAGDAGKSLEHFRRALTLDEKRLGLAPEDRQVQNDLAIDLGGIGEAHWRRGETAEAIDAYRRSLEIRTRIAAADPKNVFAQGRVAYIHHMLAKLFVSSGALRDAEDHVNMALAANEALIRIDRIYRAELAGSLQTLAEIERRKERPLAACDAYGRAQRLFALVEDRDLGADQRTSKVEVDRALALCEGR